MQVPHQEVTSTGDDGCFVFVELNVPRPPMFRREVTVEELNSQSVERSSIRRLCNI
jgi:hypothetical protein